MAQHQEISCLFRQSRIQERKNFRRKYKFEHYEQKRTANRKLISRAHFIESLELIFDSYTSAIAYKGVGIDMSRINEFFFIDSSIEKFSNRYAISNRRQRTNGINDCWLQCMGKINSMKSLSRHRWPLHSGTEW